MQVGEIMLLTSILVMLITLVILVFILRGRSRNPKHKLDGPINVRRSGFGATATLHASSGE